jgi:hypothetical protein
MTGRFDLWGEVDVVASSIGEAKAHYGGGCVLRAQGSCR